MLVSCVKINDQQFYFLNSIKFKRIQNMRAPIQTDHLGVSSYVLVGIPLWGYTFKEYL